MASLLPADRSMVDKGDVVIVVVGSRGLKLSEASEAVNAVGERTTENVRRIFSVLHDDRMGDALKVALLLTGQPDQVTRA
jgi:cell division GTPase FtsZ